MEKRGLHIYRKSKGHTNSVGFEWDKAISDMGQKWSKGLYEKDACIRDQYGFVIVTRDIGTYDLFHNDAYLITTLTINGSKFISLILLNEKILKS